LGLLLHRAERSAGQACGRALLDGCRGEQDREAEALGPRRADEPLRALNAWDASGGARRDAAADAAHPHHRRQRPDAGAGKSAGRAQDVLAQDGFLQQSERFVKPAEQAVAAEPCKPDAVQSAARSCVALAAQAALDVAAQLAARLKL
jgi:hypothetical protein